MNKYPTKSKVKINFRFPNCEERFSIGIMDSTTINMKGLWVTIKCKKCGFKNINKKISDNHVEFDYKPKFCSECGTCLLSEKEQLLLRLDRGIVECKESWGMDIEDIENIVSLLDDSRKYIKDSTKMF